MNYKQLLSRYSRLGQRVSDLSRIGRLMKAVGDPQERLRFVHIAGTNGKGSTAQMLADTLTAAGYRTGLFTSPFILRYNDRIRIDGEEITDEELDAIADRVGAALEDLPEGFSQFEVTQAMALLHYEQSGCDIVVLEAGLGGTLDSTNVIPAPEAAVITSIALDHTAILGDTTEEIAASKAGIIKPGSAAVCSACVKGKALEVIRSRAEECGTRLIVPDMSGLTVIGSDIFGTEFDFGELKRLRLRMGGEHQLFNAAAVVAAVGALRERGFGIPEAALRKGLTAQIPARVQVVSRQPVAIVDGGHNPEGVKALAAAIEDLPRPRTAVMGMLSDKDSAAAVRLIARSCERFVCVDGFAPGALPSKRLMELLTAAGARAVMSMSSPTETVRREYAMMPRDGSLIVCGSLYLASEVLNAGIFPKGDEADD